MPIPNEDSVPECQADNARPQQTGLKCRCSERGIVRQGQGADDLDSDVLRMHDSNPPGQIKADLVQWKADRSHVSSLCLGPLDGSRKQAWQLDLKVHVAA